ncbi:cytochrome b/b6 domain-containing protein [Shewanella sp. AS16]|uniref:cytochrome b/b6 domain-containing protein n=1 Tax=Shewanella sp. AS16 TaxID=2907625 RepID=UPI001F3739B0|nr:cytochrome b/b6 domain-containing protein [Shewanella sp. AS16]MCE9685302.1 cytochrome b/b6 domain-containing protein [Shewanella sp. AS16]
MSAKEIKIKVWDLPTRVFHWGMVLLLVGLWWSADAGEMQWHQLLAYTLLVFIGFRILWGFVGSDTARFKQFVHGPKRVIDYLKSGRGGELPATLGHNPLGGYMVLMLIFTLSLQLATGLFATDEIFTEGPLYSWVSAETASSLTWLHKQNFLLILGLAAIHLAAVALHWFKGDKLVWAMVSGYKKHSGSGDPRLRFTSVLVAIALLSILGSLVFVTLMRPVLQSL